MPELTAVQIAAAVRTGELTARQATQDALDRIAERDGRINAFRTVRTERALAEADAVDLRTDRFALPLAGVPVAVKDNVSVAGEAMLIGSRATSPEPQRRDHEIVKRLRRAGAVIVGITTVPELCVFGTTDSPGRITRNPRDLRRTAGGSSGGSAAAVAAGMVPIAHGNDGMGSIRIPAACCGLVGLKPGLGVVPADLGDGSWFGMAENGPLATTVEDAALMFSVLSGRPVETLDETLRIAVSVADPAPGGRVDADYSAAAALAGGVLRQAGHTVLAADPPTPFSAGLSELARWFAGTELDARRVADRSALQRRTRVHAAIGTQVLRAGYPKTSGRTRWQATAARFFAEHDVLLTPSLARLPPKARAWSGRGWAANLLSNTTYAPFAAPWNLAGWPALSVPVGTHRSGLPASVQLVGPPGSEDRLLAVAAQLAAR